MFTDLYLQTTDPKLHFSELLMPRTMVKYSGSVLFHTIIYASFFNLTSYIFLGKTLSNSINIRLFVALLLIMFLGYFARFFHVKEVYKSYNYDLEKTRNHLDKLYVTWIFIA
jgi:hypothetical protein